MASHQLSVLTGSRESPFPQVGIKIRVLEPGQPNGLYHSENQQDDFLVLGRVQAARRG
jgi:uncharacterized cupin superfamily protein